MAADPGETYIPSSSQAALIPSLKDGLPQQPMMLEVTPGTLPKLLDYWHVVHDHSTVTSSPQEGM